MASTNLLGALATFVLALGLTLISPLCLPCVAVMAGLTVGYLAINIDRPPYSRMVTTPAAIAGLFAGFGMLLGQMAGSGINTMLVGPQGVGEIMSQIGINVGSNLETGYYSGVLFSVCFIGMLNLALSAGFGVLGGQLWWQVVGTKQPPPTDPFKM